MSDDRHLLMRVMARHLLASAVELPPEGVNVLARLAADEFRRTHSRTASARDVQSFLHQSPILADIAKRMPWAWGDFHQAFNRNLRAGFAQRVAADAKFKDKKEVPKADGSGTTTVYEYSDRQISKRHNDKAKRIEKLRKSMGDLRRKVTGDLDNKDPNIRLVALAVALMDETYERVGNDGSAKDGHFGVTGWKVKHITFSQGKATMKYVGKSGVKQEKVVTNSKALKVLKAATKGKSPDEEILCEGDDCRITASHVNDYLEPFDITAKDLRGLHANEEMRSRLKAQRSKGGKLPSDKKKRDDKLKAEWTKALEAAADAVGHEAATLKSQYLVPGLEDGYLKDGTVPATLDKTGADEALADWLAGFFQRNSVLRSYQGIPVGTGTGSQEASNKGGKIVLYQKFWELSPRSQDFVMAHEIGHWVLDNYGLAKLIQQAASLGVDTWDTLSLPFGQYNAEEAFADSFASYHTDKDVQRRYPEWASLVEMVKAKVRTAAKTAIIGINNATDGPEDGDVMLRGFGGLTSSLTLFEQAVVQDMDIHSEPIIGSEGSYTLRGHKVPDDVVMELVGAGYLEETPKGVVISPMFKAKRKLYTASALTKQWGPTMHVGTKSDAEVEDEEVERLVRPSPKKKPPRKDLRRERMETDTDKEPDAEQNRKDQSQNRKDIGASLVSRLARLYLTGDATPEWAVGKTFTNPNSTGDDKVEFGSLSLDVQEKLRAQHDGGGAEEEKGGDKPEGEEEDPKAKAKAEEEAKKKQEAQAEAKKEKALQKAVGKVDAVISGVGGAVEKAHDKFDKDEKEVLAEAYTEALNKLVQNPPTSASDIAKMTALAKTKPGPGIIDDPIELGDFLAKQQYANQIITNPMMIGGVAVSDDNTAAKGAAVTQEQLDHSKERGALAYSQYNSMSSDQREDAFYTLRAEYLEAEPGSPKHTELRGLMNGVSLSMAMAGDELPYMAHVPQSYGKLGNMLKEQGEGRELALLNTVTALGSGESRQAIRSLMDDLSDEDLIEVAGGESGHFSGWVRLLQGTAVGDIKGLGVEKGSESVTLNPKQAAVVRDKLRREVLDTMTFKDPLIGEVLKASGKKVTPEAVAEFHAPDPGGMFTEALGSEDPGEAFDAARQSGWARLKEKLKSVVEKAKSTPRLVGLWGVLNEAVSSGNSEVIDQGVTGDVAEEIGMAVPKEVRGLV